MVPLCFSVPLCSRTKVGGGDGSITLVAKWLLMGDEAVSCSHAESDSKWAELEE